MSWRDNPGIKSAICITKSSAPTPTPYSPSGNNGKILSASSKAICSSRSPTGGLTEFSKNRPSHKVYGQDRDFS